MRNEIANGAGDGQPLGLGKTPVHDGAWGKATLEVALAIQASAREGREIALKHQVAVP
jgi:hypothetical protein